MSHPPPRVELDTRDAKPKTRQPLMESKQVGRRASFATEREYKCDYLDIPSRFPFVLRTFQKQGDQRVLFADKVFKFTGSGKMKRRILLITEFAIYIADPEANVLKRRIALTTIEKLCMSKLADHFFAIVVPTEYDCLLASTRKMEIVSTMVEATKNSSIYKFEVTSSNRFEYHAASDLTKQVHFEEVEGGVKTRIMRT